jgi:glycosyltransferase involved in cell wall biosynthesis
LKKYTRIALINDYPENTGIGKYAFNLFNELKKKIDVEMIFLGDTEKKEKIRSLGTGISFPILKKTLNSHYFYPKRIPKEYDLFHASNQFLARIANHRKPSIVTCMDMIPLTLKKDYPFAMRIFIESSMKAMNKAEKIIAISDFTKKELTEKFGVEEKKIKTIHLGYDKKIFKKKNKNKARKKLGLNKNKTYLLNVGSEEKRKNVHELIKAVKDLDVELIRVGEQRTTTKKLIQKENIQNVSYTKNISDDKLAEYYNAVDLSVFPSTHEGFGLPILEAMACNCPVLTTKYASIPEITGKLPVVLEKINETEIKEKIKEVLENKSLKNSLKKRGLKKAKKFSWKKTAKETLKVYESVLK